jgi:hypothetical protein
METHYIDESEMTWIDQYSAPYRGLPIGREIGESDRSYQSVLVLPIGMQVCFLSLSAFDAPGQGRSKRLHFHPGDFPAHFNSILCNIHVRRKVSNAVVYC